MKQVKLIITLLTLLVTEPTFAFAAKVVAIVADKPITEQDLDSRVKLQILSSGFSSSEPEVVKLFRQQVLESLIDERIISNEADKKGIKIDPREIDGAIEYLAKSNGLDNKSFAARLKEAGSSIEELKLQVQSQLEWQKLIKYFVESSVIVSESEIREALALQAQKSKDGPSLSYNLSEIVVGDKEFANDIIDQLKKGGDFGKLAKELSESPSANGNGAIGTVSSSQLPKEIRLALAKLSSDQWTAPLKMNGMFYIYKINSITDDSSLSDNTKRENAINFIREKKTSTMVRSYLRHLRRETYVEIKKS